MTPARLESLYRAYLDCLNRQDWPRLGDHVAEDATHNGRPFGLAGYRAMLIGDFNQIPDLRFHIAQLVAAPPHLAVRLAFACTPKGQFLSLPVNGRRIAFAEHVFYEFRAEKIAAVWSVLDKSAIEAQLGAL